MITSGNEEVKYTPGELQQLDGVYNEVALATVLKLSDATFRPFVIRLAEWATSLPKKDTFGFACRAISMFRFLTMLFSRLKVRTIGET